jgi:hypothetical protein
MDDTWMGANVALQLAPAHTDTPLFLVCNERMFMALATFEILMLGGGRESVMMVSPLDV